MDRPIYNFDMQRVRSPPLWHEYMYTQTLYTTSQPNLMLRSLNLFDRPTASKTEQSTPLLSERINDKCAQK